MNTVYQLWVNGLPKAQPRPRLASGGKVFNPSSADAWKNQIKADFLSCRRETIATPVSLIVIFYLPMPKDKKKKQSEVFEHNAKPDLDNLLKAVMDSLTNVRIWEDDALVYKIVSEKWYHPTKTGARIIIEA